MIYAGMSEETQPENDYETRLEMLAVAWRGGRGVGWRRRECGAERTRLYFDRAANQWLGAPAGTGWIESGFHAGGFP